MPHAKFNIEYAYAQFSELLDRAHAGEEILITKDQEPYAKLLPPAWRGEGTRAGEEISATNDHKSGKEHWPLKKRGRRRKAPLKHLNLPDIFEDEYPKQAVNDIDVQ